MRKPAPLAAGVLLKKGEAAPVFGSQGRDGPSIASARVASLPAEADTPPRARTAELEPLGSKVPPQVNQEFRRFAFDNGYKLDEQLFAASHELTTSRRMESANS